jgi:hypothetical protein
MLEIRLLSDLILFCVEQRVGMSFAGNFMLPDAQPVLHHELAL